MYSHSAIRSFPHEVARVARSLFRRAIQARSISLYGLHISIDPDIFSDSIRDALYAERYEYEERSLVSSVVVSTDRVLEIGSAIGFVSMMIHRKNPQASIHFEPNAGLVEQARMNCRQNDIDLDFVSAAIVSADFTEDEVTLNVGDDFWSGSIARAGTDAKHQSVPAVRIDQVLSDFAPTVLVVDIEGAECDVLTDVELAGVRALILELHRRYTDETKMRKLLISLMEQGFNLDLDLSIGENVVFSRTI